MWSWSGAASPARPPAWLRASRIPAVILEASSRPTGSWPRYYDTLRLFSPAAFSSLTGMPFPADPVLATGYRPSLHYLRELGAIDQHGAPIHVGGISTTHPGLVYIGLDNQRSFASNTLRGVSADADAAIATLAVHVRDAPGTIRLSKSARGTTGRTRTAHPGSSRGIVATSPKRRAQRPRSRRRAQAAACSCSSRGTRGLSPESAPRRGTSGSCRPSPPA